MSPACQAAPASTKTAFCSLAALACALIATTNSAATDSGRYSFRILAGFPGTKGYVDGVGSAARFDSPGGMAVDAAGNVYLSERNLSVIRKISPEGVVSTLAGTAGQSGAQDGIGAAARFNTPSSLAVDRAGNIYVADTENHTIRKIDPSGMVTTFAGKTGETGRVDGAREIARLGWPASLAVDDSGNLFLCDGPGLSSDAPRRLRKITPDGAVSSLAISGMTNAFITLEQVCLGSSGCLYVTIREAGPFWDLTDVHKFTPTAADGHYQAAPFDSPGVAPWIWGMGSDETGRLFVRDRWDHTFVYLPDGSRQIRDHAGSSDADRDLDASDLVAVSRSGALYLFRNDWSSRSNPPGAVEVEVFEPDPTAPEIRLQPRSQAIGMGRTVAFNVAATGTPAPAYQWIKDGIAIAGATDATLILTETSAASAGSYQCIATNSSGAVTSNAALLSIVDTTDVGRISGFSARADLFAASRLVAGLVVSGGSKPMLLRAVGPGLSPFMPGTFLKEDPRLELYDAAGTLAQANNDWGGDAALARAFASAGTFPLASDSRDAALLRSFGGAHTAHVFGNSYGMVLLEAFDVGGETASRLANLSARSPIYDRDGTLIAGVVVTGATSQTVLIRGVGPALASFGVIARLADPKLEVFNGAHARLAENDNWPPGLAPIAGKVGAFALPAGSRDAAVLVTLPPGSYTAVLSGVGGVTGEALLEVYEVP